MILSIESSCDDSAISITEVKTKKLKIYIYRLNKMLRIFLVSEEKKLAKKLKEIK